MGLRKEFQAVGDRALLSRLAHDLKVDTINVKQVTDFQWFYGLTMIFFADACATQYEFTVVNGQTTTSGFHKVVQQQY